MQTFAAANANQWVTDISVTTDVGLLKATNPSARRITYARRSIARCLLSYSKGFGLPAKQHLALAGGWGLTPKSSSPDMEKR